MQELMKAVDYTEKEAEELPVSWLSSHGLNIAIAGAYEKECKAKGKAPSPEKVAELLGNNLVHLRKHMLENGLRYVTIHQADGTEILDDCKYIGLTSCSCGAIHDMPTRISATWDIKNKPDLGDGFILQGTHPASHGAIMSTIHKEFAAAGKRMMMHYSLSPDYRGDGGCLYFEFAVDTTGTLFKHMEIKIWSRKRQRPNTIGQSSILITYNLPYNVDQVEFNFDGYSRLHEIAVISQGDMPNPELAEGQALAAIMQGKNRWFKYNGEDPRAKILAKAVFGEDITRLRHNLRGTLNALVDAAKKETDIDLVKAAKFV